MYHYLGRYYYLPALLLTVFNVLGSQFSADWLLLLFSDQITPHSYWRMQIKKGKGFDAASITMRYVYPVGSSLAVCSSEQNTGHVIIITS